MCDFSPSAGRRLACHSCAYLRITCAWNHHAGLREFSKTDQGGAFISDKATSVYLSSGSILLVPFGYLPVIVLLADHKNDAQCGHLVVYTAMAAGWSRKLPNNVWANIFAANVAAQKTKSEDHWQKATTDLDKLDKETKKVIAA